MKIITTTPEKKEFEPITIQITIESEKELYELWHRLNIVDSYISDMYKEESTKTVKPLRLNGDTLYAAFKLIDKLVEERGIEL